MTVVGQREHRPTGSGAARVVIVGAGFGGLAAMRQLARTGTQTTLIDRNVYSTFQPLLYEVATAGLTSSDIAFPARSVSRRYHAAFRHGELTSIDPRARQITLADGATLRYDYLILATGVSVIGGGATGVELAGSLADLRNIALAASYPEIDRTRVHVSLIERAPALLAPFHPALREYTRRQLAKRGVEVRLGTAIAEITPNRVLLADGTALPSDITIWAAGVAAPEPVSSWGLPQADGGRIRTGPDLRVIGHDRIFAVGDIAVTEDQPLPQLAQPAMQMGKHAVGQIHRLEAGQLTAPFRYRDKGIMATIGYRSAVVQLPRRLRIHGTLAWLAWLALHFVTLLGRRNRISALVNMSSRYLTWQHGGGLIVGDGMTGLVPQSAPAGQQALSHTSTDPTPTGPDPG